MLKRFVYFYFMKNEPDRIAKLISEHVQYWHQQKERGVMGGPFRDKSGGLIIFQAASSEAAAAIAEKDPFARESVLEMNWVKEWVQTQ